MESSFYELFKTIPWLSVTYALIIFLAGLLFARALGRLCFYYSAKRTSESQARTFQRLTFYIILTIFILIGLQQLGFQLGVLLGAAGIFSIAIGFASQNAMSNMISGIFLTFERPFHPGHIIQVKGFTGEVITIDLLSTKIRQFDNTLVRIPNEAMLKAEITNLSHFHTRRIDFTICVDYQSDLPKVSTVLLTTIKNHTDVLKSPEPVVRFDSFAESSINFKCFAWVKTAQAIPLKAQLQEAMKDALNQAGINIPYPHLTVVQK